MMKWNVAKIGDVCQTGAGGTPLKSKKGYYEGGDVPWLLSGEVSQGEIFTSTNFITKLGLENSSAKIFPVNTVLVAMYGATAGQTGILRFEAATNQAVCGIYPNEKFIPEFLYYCLLSKKEQLISQAVGNAQPNISQEKIRNTEIPVPPLSEQLKVVNNLQQLLSDIDESIASVQKNVANISQLFDSRLDKIFFLDGKDIHKFPLSEILLKTENVNPALKPLEEFTYIDVSSVSNKTFQVESTQKLLGRDAPSRARKLVKTDDIIFATVRPTLKRVAVIPSELDGQVCSTGYFVLRPKDGLHYRYLFYYLLSRQFQKQMERLQKGASYPAVTDGDVSSQLIPLPSLQDQIATSTRLDELVVELKKLEQGYREKLLRLRELRNTVLNLAISGKL